TAPTNSTPGTPLTVAATVVEPANVFSLSYIWTVTLNGQAHATVSTPSAAYTFTPIENGVYGFTLTVTDTAGAVGSGSAFVFVSDTVTLTSVHVPPLVTIAGPTSGSRQHPIALSGTVAEPAGGAASNYTWTVTLNGQPYSPPDAAQSNGVNATVY